MLKLFSKFHVLPLQPVISRLYELKQWCNELINCDQSVIFLYSETHIIIHTLIRVKNVNAYNSL